MTSIPFQAITSKATGSVIRFGASDLSPGLNPATEDLHIFAIRVHWIPDLPIKYHKIVGGLPVEMTAPEKAAVDAEQDTKHTAQLKGAGDVTLTVPNLAALPVPPPARGRLVGVADVGGVPALAISTNTGYIVFKSDGTHP